MNALSERISPHYAVLNYRGKRMFRDHQTQIKKIVYFPAEFFLGMTVKRKLFFLLSVPQVTQRNFDFDPRAPNASSDKNLCLSHGSNHFCATTPPDKCFHSFNVLGLFLTSVCSTYYSG